MSLYIPKMSDTPGVTIPGLASNFNLLAGSQIVEHGSNENGEYWRWENGLQVCMLSFETELLSDVHLDEMYEYEKLGENAPLSEGAYGALRWYYPAQFSEIPYCNARFAGRHRNSLSHMSTAVRIHHLRDLNYINFDVRHSGGRYTSGASYMLAGGLMAIGRWK